MLIARLGADPESRFTPSGSQIVTMRVATTRKWKDKDGQRQEETEWHRIVMYGKLAEIAAKYLKKGSLAYFDGRIHTNKWQDQSGQDRYTTEIIAESMNMLDSKPQCATQQNTAPANIPQPASYDDIDDDIPFDSLNWQIRRHLI